MNFDNETIKELTSVLPDQFRELRPEGKAWTVSKAAYIQEIRQMMVFHLDCKKLILADGSHIFVKDTTIDFNNDVDE